MYKNIGIDLGASGVVVSIAGEGIFSLRDVPPALRRKDGSFPGFGVGEDQNGTDGNGEVTPRSASHEITVDPEACRLVLSEVITHYSSQGQVPRLLLSIPCGFGEVEENVLVETAVEAGARDVYLLYSPLAALLGNELDPSLSAVVVDIGAVRTNMIAVCRGRMIYKKTFLVGGDDFDRAIAGYMLNKSKVAIDPETAEEVKIGVGTVWIANERRMMEVHGRDATNGDYCTVRISSEEMFTALEEPMAALIEGVCKTITKSPRIVCRMCLIRAFFLREAVAFWRGSTK